MTLVTTCARCGTAMQSDDAFCKRCGAAGGEQPVASALIGGSEPPRSVSFAPADVLSRLAAALSMHYRVERELGRGGMATVFLAHDVKHDREVAIKVLHPELAATMGGERFEREIRLAAKLQHPNILGLYDSGNAGGLLYYVMPFVKGESLRDRIDREGQLPIDDALLIAIEVANALGHAHEYGVVHRDIKPENILLAGEHALVADFGIARAASEGQQKLTATGVAVGTPVYMAPEQSSGEPAGPTADLYSLACVVYEMLAGEPPFTGKNAMQLMARHALEQVPSIRIVRPAVSEEIEEALFVALNKAPADRPQTAAQFVELLGLPVGTATMRATMRTPTLTRRIPTGLHGIVPPAPPVPWWRRRATIAASSALVALATGGAWYARSLRPPATSLDPSARRIAVLYFDDRSRDASLAPLANGLTEGLIGALGASRSLTVISRTGVEPFRATELPVDSVARALRVGYLVRGEVEPEGSDVRLTVRLDDASGANVRRATLVRPAGNALALRDTLTIVAAELIREQLGMELEAGSQRAGTASQAAWLLVQRAEQQRRQAEAAARAGDAAALDASFLAADSLLAAAEAEDRRWAEPVVARANLAYRRSRLVGKDPAAIRAWVEVGMNHADRAVALDLTHADALEVRGNLRYWSYLSGLEADPGRKQLLLAGAQADLEKATQLNPRQAGAFATLSHLYNQTRTTADVNIAAQRALEADEFLVNADVVLARLFNSSYDLAQFDKAELWCNELRRRYAGTFRSVGCPLYLLTGNKATPDVARAWRIADSAVAVAPAAQREYQRHYLNMLVAAVIARASKSQPALADSARAVARRSVGDGEIDAPRDLAFLGARVHVILGDKAAAIRLLTEHFSANPSRAEAVRDDPGWYFRDLASDPEFRRIVGG